MLSMNCFETPGGASWGTCSKQEISSIAIIGIIIMMIGMIIPYYLECWSASEKVVTPRNIANDFLHNLMNKTVIGYL